jgi:dUTPase
MLTFIRTAEEAQTPMRGSSGACGFDLPLPHSVSILPGEKVLLDLHLRVSFPEGFMGRLELRSSCALRYSLTLLCGVIGEHISTFFSER